MPQQRKWTDDDLRKAVIANRSIRAVIYELGLVPAGGNYKHVMRRISDLKLNTEHFMGKGWNTGWNSDPRKAPTPTSAWLVNGSAVQSNTLKRRLFREGIKKPACEICGWSKTSIDGRIPVELDHINGNSADHRLSNLRILCPNCHSLQPTHRGKNKKLRYARVT